MFYISDKKLRSEMKQLGLDLVMEGIFEDLDICETFEVEIEMNELQTTIAEMEAKRKQLEKEIEEHKKQIKLLTE
jgi:seryl-tRNA synthetase